MTELPLDFDNVLAYAIPGLLLLVGAAWLNPTWQESFHTFHATYTGSALLAMGVLTLVAGLLLGSLRSAVLKPFDTRDLRWAYRSESFAPLTGDWEPIDYGRIVDEGHLGALHEARVNERTPYQFFGNTLVAIMLLVIARVTLLCRARIGHRITLRACIRRTLAAILIFALALVVLYPSYRTKRYRYGKAIEAINAA
jgi:cytochrome bd-type quinol oxidase subunit 2